MTFHGAPCLARSTSEYLNRLFCSLLSDLPLWLTLGWFGMSWFVVADFPPLASDLPHSVSLEESLLDPSVLERDSGFLLHQWTQTH